MKLLLLLCRSVAIARLVHAFDISLKMSLPSKDLSNDKKVSANHLFMSSTDDEGENDLSERSSKGLNELLTPSKDCKVNRMSGTDLAYIGDVVFELYVRSRHVWPSKRTSDLQNRVVAIVRAEHQSHLLAQLRENFELSDEETQILMRGRNAVTRSKNRRNPAAYQDSTAFECLLGYLYISDQERCCELLNWIETIVDEPS